MPGYFYLEYMGEGETERYRLDQLPCTVGRSADCDVRLPREEVSRRHARFERHREGLMLVDLESTNSTFVNLERIHTPTLVKPGDSIHFANHEFRLALDDPSGQTTVSQRETPEPPAGRTLAGFTAEPVGFPVQAPQFYELLNEELISPCTRPIVTTRERAFGLVLGGISAYSKLNAGYQELRHLAEQMGEESRFNAMVRQHALQAAEQAGLINPVVFADIQAGEMEDHEVLINELKLLARQHSRLWLAFAIPPVGVGRNALDDVAKSLKGLDVELALTDIDPADPRQLALCSELADYVFVDSSYGLDPVKEAEKELGTSTRIIVDRIDNTKTLEQFRTLETVLLCGKAVGESKPIS